MYYICFMVHNKKEYFKGLFLEAISNPQITTKHDWNQRNGYTPVNFWIDGEAFLLQLGISYDSIKCESDDRDIPTTFESKHSIEIWKVYAMTQGGDEYELELNNEQEAKVTDLINSKIWL